MERPRLLAEDVKDGFNGAAEHHAFDAGKNATLQAELPGVSNEEKNLRQCDVARPFARSGQVTPMFLVPNDSIHADSSAAVRRRLN